MTKGVVYLIPTYLSDSNDNNFLAPMVIDIILHTNHFLVENVRTARRFISSLNLGIDISSLDFHVVDKNTDPAQVQHLTKPLTEGKNIGIISEAGLPGLADPGSMIVSWAHQNNIRIIPLPGATSIHSAVITSGFSGQQYVFHGYLPIQKHDRVKAIKEMENNLRKTGYTQVFMETPYRNMNLMEDLLSNLSNSTALHIASDLFGSKELAKTMTIQNWKKTKIDLHKIPTVFCIGQMS